MIVYAIAGLLLIATLAYIAWVVEHDVVQVIIVTSAFTVLLCILAIAVALSLGIA